MSEITFLDRQKQQKLGTWLICLAFLATLPFLSWSLGTNVAGGDGHMIYAYLRSAVMDGDLQFEDEYRHQWPQVGLYGLIRQMGTDKIIHSVDSVTQSYKDDPSTWGDTYGYPSALFMDPTKTGHLPNQHAAGPTLLWLPFFIAGHGVAWFLSELGVSVSVDGYSLPYTIAVGLGSALSALGTMLLVYRMLWRFVQPYVTAMAVVLIYLASPLVVYAIQTPIAAMAPSAFACALFLYLGIEIQEHPKLWKYWAWGVVGGWMITVRFESAALFVFAGLISIAHGITAWKQSNRKQSLLDWLKNYGVFSLGVLIGLLPQMIAGTIIYGAPWITFYPAFSSVGGKPGEIYLASPHWWDVLWSTRKGLFSWHPILLPSTIGLFLLWRKGRLLTIALTLSLAAQVYVIGCWEYWAALTGFGQRYFINMAPLFMIGLGVLLERLQKRVSLWVLGGIGGIFVLWNLGLFIQYGLGLISRQGAFEWANVFYNQFVFIPRLVWARLLAPFSPWSFAMLALVLIAFLGGGIWWHRFQAQKQTF